MRGLASLALSLIIRSLLKTVSASNLLITPSEWKSIELTAMICTFEMVSSDANTYRVLLESCSACSMCFTSLVKHSFRCAVNQRDVTKELLVQTNHNRESKHKDKKSSVLELGSFQSEGLQGLSQLLVG